LNYIFHECINEYNAPNVPTYPSCLKPNAIGFYSGWFFIKKEKALLTHSNTKLLLRQKNPVKTTFLTLCNLKYINDNWAILEATITKRLLAISCFLEFY
jgi:hypothetical protein